MNTNVLKTAVATAAILIAGSFASATAQTVTGSIAKGKITRGIKARATVVLEIPHDLHVNSNRPGSEYAIPTTVKIAPVSGVKIGAVAYPRGINKRFAFAEKALNIYEGRVVFGFDVTVPALYRGKSVKINVTVRYQACTTEVCYPPKSKQVILTANVL